MSRPPGVTHDSPEDVPHMATTPVIVALPIADRQTSFTFYRDGLGFEPIGEVADDGVPEPLQFVLNDGVRLMLIPAGGFGWVIGDREVAMRGSSECVLSLAAETETGVERTVERACEAGAEIVTAPGHQPWGYAGAFADPDGHVWMVTSQPFPT
jgi:predicted lactoylglutathione lyase